MLEQHIQFGIEHLQSPEFTFGWVAYYNLDVMAVYFCMSRPTLAPLLPSRLIPLLCCRHVNVAVIFMAVRALCRYCCCARCCGNSSSDESDSPPPVKPSSSSSAAVPQQHRQQPFSASSQNHYR
jgi:hypothetical protein